MTDHDERGYMTPEELGRFLTLHPLTLWWWRVTPWGETGPAYVRDHGQIRYPTAAVATWLEARYHPVQDGLDDL